MAKKKKADAPKKITNRRARFDYELGDGFVAGIELSGAETKALRMGHGQLRGAYVTMKQSPKGGELFLINATISPTSGIPISESDQTRARKLLAKRREIDALVAAKQQGNTIVPLELLTGGRFIKLRVAIGRGKKRYDKRQSLKTRDENRNIKAAHKVQNL
jgi:SsrA-binding protein